MKLRWLSLQWLIIFAVVLLSLISGFNEDQEVRQIIDKAELAAAQDINVNSQSEQQAKEQRGAVFSVADNSVPEWRFTTAQLQTQVGALPANRRHLFYTWSGDDQQEIAGSASGVDKLAYFASSYLVGYSPFETANVWEPLAILALRKAYVLDHKLYGPNMSEIWQNSRQAYRYSRGDCEDHAIILADWLIEMGHNARVVLGKYKNGGHAWVVLFKDGKEYILEATSKRRPHSTKDFKLAALATDYHPQYQFDRENFWVNTGSKYTTRYKDKKWQLRSTFSRYKPS